MANLSALLARLAEINHLEQALAVLDWDRRTYMPPKGTEARAKHVATLAKLAHEMFVDKATQDLLAAAEAEGAGYAAESNERAMLRVARRAMDKATKVPTTLVIELAQVCSLAEDVWQKARAENDYASFAPWLEKILKLKRQYVAALGYGAGQKRIYDVLLDDFEEGMTTEALNPILEDLKRFTIPLVAAIQERQDRVTSAPLTQEFSAGLQQAFATQVMKDCGFAFDRGRLDVSTHPFCTSFSPNDVRVTTRYERNWLPAALFGCLHEMGHALYEMNISAEFEGTPLAGGISLGVHESQSRLWENLVGRSREFWQRYYPALQQTFAGQLATTPVETFYKSINRVTPSLIRVEADEVTYNLHIILRYEMEQELLEERLSVADAPAAWNAKMRKSLGLTPPTDREGILQDVHWAMGGMGYFPTYTLGNVLAAQLFEAAGAAIPSLREEIRNGRFAVLLEWLRANVHRHGKKYIPAELVRRAAGGPLTTEPYERYLKSKFSEVYGL